MVTATEAIDLILRLVPPFNSSTDLEIIPLAQAIGRILATPVKSKLDYPHWDNSAMDGYAVRYQDLQSNPVKLKIVGEIQAGTIPDFEIKEKQAARIFTGAMIPTGADTIVMQEHTELAEDHHVLIKQNPPSLGAFIRKAGSFYQQNTCLLPSQIKITPTEISVLAAMQSTHIPVYRRLQIGILSTGNELVTLGDKLQPGQLVDSNQWGLISAIEQTGAIVHSLGIIKDDPSELRKVIVWGLEKNDFLISSGGVSVGDYDYITQIVTELGGTFLFDSVAIKPGKPFKVARFDHHKLLFALPGNPVSAMVTFWRFVLKAIEIRSGLSVIQRANIIEVETRDELRSGGDKETYLWGRLVIVNNHFQFQLSPGTQNSANLINLALTNGLAIIPIGTKEIKSGQAVQVLMI